MSNFKKNHQKTNHSNPNSTKKKNFKKKIIQKKKKKNYLARQFWSPKPKLKIKIYNPILITLFKSFSFSKIKY